MLPGNGGKPNPVRGGGGVIKLTVDETLTFNGTASAAYTGHGAVVGGAGTINIQAARLEGNGLIRASVAESVAKWVGGGRVAVRLTDAVATFSDHWKANITARGVAYVVPWSGKFYNASAGTVYLQNGSQAEGEGTVYIAQNGLELNWTTACTNDLTAFPSTRHGGERDDFRKAALDISGGAHVLITRDVALKNLAVAEHSTIELNGNTVAVKNCAMGGLRIPPGIYRAADPLVAAYLDDASPDAGGKLAVIGDATLFLVR